MHNQVYRSPRTSFSHICLFQRLLVHFSTTSLAVLDRNHTQPFVSIIINMTNNWKSVIIIIIEMFDFAIYDVYIPNYSTKVENKNLRMNWQVLISDTVIVIYS